jgi:hypothetical protein
VKQRGKPLWHGCFEILVRLEQDRLELLEILSGQLQLFDETVLRMVNVSKGKAWHAQSLVNDSTVVGNRYIDKDNVFVLCC